MLAMHTGIQHLILDDGEPLHSLHPESDEQGCDLPGPVSVQLGM